MAKAQRGLIRTYEMQHYLAFPDAASGDFGEFVRVTEDKTFDTSRDANEYEGQYLCDRSSTTYRLGNKDSISFEIDLVGPDGIQQHLGKLEDEMDVPVLYVRTLAWDFEANKACDQAALKAKSREGKLNLDPISGDAGAPLSVSGAVSFDGGSEWEYGTFDATTRKFTKN